MMVNSQGMIKSPLVNIEYISLPLSRFQPAPTKTYGIESLRHENTHILLEMHFNSKVIQLFVTPNICLERNAIHNFALFQKMLLYLFKCTVFPEILFFLFIYF